jgi:antitoxin component YwqK of YwqJK toxin-antitoxin module
MIFIVGCRPDKKMIIVKGDSGALLERYEINQDSLKDGKFISFYESGDTFEVSNYTNGKLNGARFIYYEKNKIEIKEHYTNDSLQGRYEAFYPSGALKRTMQFEDNRIVGKLLLYYENGQLKEEVVMENNQENGPFVEYYENGQKSWEGTYQNGENEIGLLIHYAENGDTIRKLQCDDRYICRTFYRNENYPKEEG